MKKGLGQVGDWLDIHYYVGPGSPLVTSETATQNSALGEYGGLGLIIPAHMLRPADAFYYELESSAAVLLVRDCAPKNAHDHSFTFQVLSPMPETDSNI